MEDKEEPYDTLKDLSESSRDPAQELLLLLFYTGIVKTPGKPSRLYPCMVGFAYLILVADALISIYLFEDHPFDDKIETIQCSISFVHLVGKIFNLKLRSNTFWTLINDSRNIWKELADIKENKTIMEDLSVLLRKTVIGVMVISLAPVPMSIMLAMFRNLNLERDQWETVYKIWDPIRDTLGEDWFWTRNLYQTVILIETLYLFVAVYCALIVPCLIARGQMIVLNRMLDAEEIDVAACVRLHQTILKYVDDINNLFSAQMFLDMALSALYISFRSYQVIQMVNNHDPRVLGAVFIVSICFGAPFLVCLCGHLITEMSEEIHRKAAQGAWYKLPVKDQKDLCFLMSRASTPLSLQYHNLMGFNMVQYGAMVQATYSYITLLTGV